MRNDESGQEHSATPPVRRCGYCGQPLLSQRRGAKWCSREHKELARQRRKRASDRLTSLRARHPLPDSAGLPEFDLTGLDDEHQDDEYGIVADESGADPWQQRNDAWAARQELAAGIDRIRAEYEPLLRPYRQTMGRNPGVVLPELASLLRERDSRIRGLNGTHQLAEAMERAARDRPGRVASARERQDGQAAARSFAADLGRGRFLTTEPEPAGRDVHSAWVW